MIFKTKFCCGTYVAKLVTMNVLMFSLNIITVSPHYVSEKKSLIPDFTILNFKLLTVKF